MTAHNLVTDNPGAAAVELREAMQQGDIGAAVGPVMHELGNQINTIFLSLSSLERKIPEEWREQIQDLRQLGRRVAAITNQFAGFRSRKQPPPYSLDLNQVIQATLEELGGETPVTWKPAPDLPPVLANRSDLKRLVRFLVTNALQTIVGEPPRLSLATVHNGQVELHMQDNGLPLIAESPQTLFDPFTPQREGASSLELAACQSLLRRWNGNLVAENHPGGGVVWTATFSVAESGSS